MVSIYHTGTKHSNKSQRVSSTLASFGHFSQNVFQPALNSAFVLKNYGQFCNPPTQSDPKFPITHFFSSSS